MTGAALIHRVAAELALFASVGFLIFSLDDLLVDIIFFVRRGWRRVTVYRRHARTDLGAFAFEDIGRQGGWMVVMIPAWDEARVRGMRTYTQPEPSLENPSEEC